MSPVSRGRKGRKNKKSTQRLAPPELYDVPDELYDVPDERYDVGDELYDVADECDCPLCSAEDFDPQDLIDELVVGAEDLVRAEDPLEAEITGAVFLSIGMRAGTGFDEALINGFIPQLEARASDEALAMLLAVGSVTDDRTSKVAYAAADRMVEAGIGRPGWAAELDEPVTVADCRRMTDTAGTSSMLTCTFHRAGRTQALLMSVDHLDCGAATGIHMFESEMLAQALEMARAAGKSDGVELIDEALDAAEFRWQVEKALDARAVHDSDDLGDYLGDYLGDDVDDDGDGAPDYPVLAVLLRARMSALPVSSKPPAQHHDPLAGRVGSPFGMRLSLASAQRKTPAALPARRSKSRRTRAPRA